MSNIADGERVCLKCGQPPGATLFCASCGSNLSGVAALPTRADWLSANAPPDPPSSNGPPSPPSAPAVTTPFDPQVLIAESQLGQLEDATETPVAPDPIHHESGVTEGPPKDGRAFWGYRTGAWLLQLGAVGALVGILSYAISGSGDEGDWIGLVAIGAYFGVTVGFTLISRGQTLGMYVAGIRVEREDGRPLSFGYAIVRFTLCGIIFLVPFVSLAEWLTPLGDERRSLRDRIASTYVVKLDTYRSRRWALAVATLLSLSIYVAAIGLAQEASQREDRNSYISDCLSSGDTTASQCGCRYDEVSARLTDSDSEAIDALGEDEALPGNIQSKVDQAVSSCE